MPVVLQGEHHTRFSDCVIADCILSNHTKKTSLTVSALLMLPPGENEALLQSTRRRMSATAEAKREEALFSVVVIPMDYASCGISTLQKKKDDR